MDYLDERYSRSSKVKGQGRTGLLGMGSYMLPRQTMNLSVAVSSNRNNFVVSEITDLQDLLSRLSHVKGAGRFELKGYVVLQVPHTNYRSICD